MLKITQFNSNLYDKFSLWFRIFILRNKISMDKMVGGVSLYSHFTTQKHLQHNTM